MIVISEDVWSADFEALAESFPVLREPDLWSNKDELKAKLADATALVVRNRTQVTREIIEAAPKLKVIARAGVGLDNIDIKAADDVHHRVHQPAPRGGPLALKISAAMCFWRLRQVISNVGREGRLQC